MKKIYSKIKHIFEVIKQVYINIETSMDEAFSKMTPEERARWYSQFFNH